MNEEEKKVVGLLQHCQNTYIEDTLVTRLQLTTEEAKILLNLVDKQQKEIEELKEKNKILEELLQGRLFELYNYYKELAGKYQGNCISKDKIREIIGKYVDIEEHLVYHHQELWGADLAEMIKELLGE